MNKKIAKMAYIETNSTMSVSGMNAILTTYKATPNKSALLIVIPSEEEKDMTVQKEWFNGEKGGSYAMMQPTKELTEEEIADKKKASFPFAQLHYFSNKKMYPHLYLFKTAI